MVEVSASQTFEGGQRIDRVPYRNGHQYKVYHDHSLPDGTVIPGVTSVLSAAIAKPFLVPWTAKLFREALDKAIAVEFQSGSDLYPTSLSAVKNNAVRFHEEATTKARDWGTKTHAAMDAILGGHGSLEKDPFLIKVGQALKAYLALKGVVNLQQEVILYDPAMGVAGTADLIGEVTATNNLYIADYKATGSFYAEQAYQAAAYAEMFMANRPIQFVGKGREGLYLNYPDVEVIRLPQEPEEGQDMDSVLWVNPKRVDYHPALGAFERALAMYNVNRDFGNPWAGSAGTEEAKESNDG